MQNFVGRRLNNRVRQVVVNVGGGPGGSNEHQSAWVKAQTVPLFQRAGAPPARLLPHTPTYTPSAPKPAAAASRCI